MIDWSFRFSIMLGWFSGFAHGYSYGFERIMLSKWSGGHAKSNHFCTDYRAHLSEMDFWIVEVGIAFSTIAWLFIDIANVLDVGKVLMISGRVMSLQTSFCGVLYSVQ